MCGMILFTGMPNENTPIRGGVRSFLDGLLSIWWVHSKRGETYTRIPDIYRAGQLFVQL